MVYLILTLVLLSAVHFAYEMIVAPSLRLAGRYRLFALRDELRTLKAAGVLEEQHFRHLEDSLNALVRSFDAVNLTLLLRWRHVLRHDAAFRERVERRLRTLDECENPAARRIRAQSVRVAVDALAINCGGGFLYLMPVLLLVRGFSTAKGLVRSLASIPESDWNRVGPLRAKN